MKKTFSKVLIANRGEISVRIAAACRALGLKSVAVYSEADAGAVHTRAADEAVAIGPSSPVESYLNIPNLLEAASRSGAEAVHPGYGFLSEQARFAEAVQKAGLVWIGPDPKVITLMGNKIAAKKAARKAKVPTLAWAVLKDGYTPRDLKAAAAKVGFPLLLKAAVGGGGRGMRLVESVGEVEQKAESAVREAQGAFGSGELFLEAYLKGARHIEVQILGDWKGNVIALGERECSVQRRHQKVIEEAPAPGLSEKTRAALWAAAVRLAKAVGYVNAGTCEFLVDAREKFHFLEMNTRLQVEHPVTECVWGVDLPVLQLQIALGGEVPRGLAPRGHAMEARLYAEDPSNGFMPSPGRLTHVAFPAAPGLRVDSGYETASEVPLFYDAMLAKVVTWGMDREQARVKLAAALENTVVAGVACNRNYLLDILQHADFIKGRVTTQFLGEKFKSWKGETRAKLPVAEAPSPGASAKEAVGLPSPWLIFGSASGNGKLGAGAGFIAGGHAHHELPGADEPVVEDRLLAEYPGKILKVLVKAGQAVKKGQTVVVCESMKMEFSYSAPFETRVKAVKVSEGQLIPAGAMLVEWEER